MAIVGAGIQIPAGALKNATAIVIGTAASIDPPAGGDPVFETGPAVFFGPEGLSFETSVTITLPANVTAGQAGVTVLQNSVSDGVETISSGITVNNGSATFPASHFSSFQVFSDVRPPPTEQKLTASNGQVNDGLAFTSAIDGNTAVSSAWTKAGGRGSVYVFDRNGAGVWFEGVELFPADAFANDRVGRALALDGDTFVVTSTNHNGQKGAAWVFTRDGAGVWTEQQKLTAADGASFDRTGNSVEISGDTIIIGSAESAPVASKSGSAYVFTRDGAGVWTEQQKLVPADAAEGDFFGSSVDVDGDSAVIGSFGNDTTAGNTGAAYVFTRDGVGVWTELVELVASDIAAGDLFGNSVGISGDQVIVGANSDDDRGSNAGTVFFYDLNP